LVASIEDRAALSERRMTTNDVLLVIERRACRLGLPLHMLPERPSHRRPRVAENDKTPRPTEL
jgi:hypothetical protein